MRLFSSLFVSVCLLFFMQASLSATPRIINGTRTQQGDWPWMAALIYSGYPAINGQYCGGSLIHPSWVLTAGHCLLEQTSDSIKVLLGRKTLSDEGTGEIIGIKRIIIHPDYDSGIYNNPGSDMALLELEKPSSQPLLRVAEHYSDLTRENTFATVIGWGATIDSETNPLYADSLLQTSVPIISNEECNASQSYSGAVHDTMLCAGFTDGRTDACIGDSGSPLVVKTNANWQQVGIVSWGEGCGLPNFPGVYSRVPSFQDFITETVCTQWEMPAVPQLEVNIEGENAIISWSNVEGVDGYQFYYAPYSDPLSDITLKNINSVDFGSTTSLTKSLEELKTFFSNDIYVAARAYRGNCYSGYSNLGQVVIK